MWWVMFVERQKTLRAIQPFLLGGISACTASACVALLPLFDG